MNTQGVVLIRSSGLNLKEKVNIVLKAILSHQSVMNSAFTVI